VPDKEGHKTHFTVSVPVPTPSTRETPEQEHARVEEGFKREAEKLARDKQAPPEKEK